MKSITEIEFLNRARTIHGNKFKYGLFTGYYLPIEIICPLHGSSVMLPTSHLKRSGCRKCGRTKLKTTERFVIEARKIHGDRYNYGEYINSREPIEIFCVKHGVFKQIADVHLRGNGCPACAGNIPLSDAEFIVRATKKHKNKYDYSRMVVCSEDTYSTFL